MVKVAMRFNSSLSLGIGFFVLHSSALSFASGSGGNDFQSRLGQNRSRRDLPQRPGSPMPSGANQIGDSSQIFGGLRTAQRALEEAQARSQARWDQLLARRDIGGGSLFSSVAGFFTAFSTGFLSQPVLSTPLQASAPPQEVPEVSGADFKEPEQIEGRPQRPVTLDDQYVELCNLLFAEAQKPENDRFSKDGVHLGDVGFHNLFIDDLSEQEGCSFNSIAAVAELKALLDSRLEKLTGLVGGRLQDFNDPSQVTQFIYDYFDKVEPILDHPQIPVTQYECLRVEERVIHAADE